MMSCGSAQRHLVDVVRGGASEAVRLELEAHLADCGGCREARAAFGLLGALKAQPAPRLGASAERRVAEQLVKEGLAGRLARDGRALAEIPRARRGRGRFVLAGAALAVLGGITLVLVGPSRTVPRGAPVVSASVVSEGQTLEAAQAGVVAFAGSGVSYLPGTSMSFSPSTRTLTLGKGEIEVDVTEHLPQRFRVRTSRFVVEVLGTRFVVTPEGVRTLRGHVRVLDLAGVELADVPAGGAWAAPVVEPSAPPPVVRPAAPPHLVQARAVPPRPVVGAGELVARARTALAAGDAPRARGLLERALASGPTPAERPAVELLSADALLVERRSDEAVAAYRGVLRRHPRAPEGEMAAFTVGQLLLERGAEAEAGAALNDYIARYPHGRFVREARERLAQIHVAE